jgi:hypothetical protein
MTISISQTLKGGGGPKTPDAAGADPWESAGRPVRLFLKRHRRKTIGGMI